MGNALDRGRIFDAQHSYELSWRIIAVAGLLGAAAIICNLEPCAEDAGVAKRPSKIRNSPAGPQDSGSRLP